MSLNEYLFVLVTGSEFIKGNIKCFHALTFSTGKRSDLFSKILSENHRRASKRRDVRYEVNVACDLFTNFLHTCIADLHSDVVCDIRCRQIRL